MKDIKKIIEKNKILILIIGLLTFTGILYYLRTKFLIFAFPLMFMIFLLGGVGFAFFFRKEFRYRDIIGYLTNSLILGILINLLILLFLGVIGFVYSDINIFIYFCFSIFLNFVYILYERNNFIGEIKKVKISIVDIVSLFLFLIFFFFIVSICLESYHPNWDSFTFWAVDPKYIFENRVLRDLNFDILKNHAYSAYYTLLYFFSYVFLGGVFEQYASLVTVLFAFLSFLVIFNYLRYIENPLIKSFSYFSLLVALYSFLLLQGILVSMYSDVFCSFIFLFFSYILFESERDKKSYYKRFLLLSFSSFVLYLTKEPYWFFTIILLLIWVFYDFKFLKENFKYIFKKKSTYIAIVLVTSISLLFIWYLSQFQSASTLEKLKQGKGLFEDYVIYIQDIFNLFATTLSWMFFLYGSFFIMLLDTLLSKKKKIFSSIVFLVTLVVPIAFYIIRMKDLGSLSLLRYFSLGFFLLPFILSYIQTKKETKPFEQYLKSCIFLLLGVYILINIFFVNKLDFKLDSHSGRYKEFRFQEDYYNLAELIKTKILDNDKVLLVDSVGKKLGNTSLPSIYIRYYLFDNSVGGQYKSKIENFSKFVQETEPNYLLIIEYDEYWKECAGILEKDKTYLIPIEKFSETENSCPVGENSKEYVF